MSFFSEDDDDDDQDTDDFFGVEDDEKFAEMLFFSKNKNNRNRFVSFFFNLSIPRFTLLMWGHKKNRGSNRVNRGYLVVLKGKKIG